MCRHPLSEFQHALYKAFLQFVTECDRFLHLINHLPKQYGQFEIRMGDQLAWHWLQGAYHHRRRMYQRCYQMNLQFFIGEGGVFRVSKREPDESFIECIYRDDDNDST